MRSDHIDFGLEGELGNQLFIWATGYKASKLRNCSLRIVIYANPWRLSGYKIPHVDLIKRFPLYMKFYKRAPLSWKYRQKIEDTFRPLPDKSLLKAKVFLGYFQSWKNFESERQDIRNLLKLQVESPNLIKLKKLLLVDPFLAVHIRRGRSGLSILNKDFHGVLPLEYYQNAIKVMKNYKIIKKVVFFTDNKSEAELIIKQLGFEDSLVLGEEDLASQSETLELMTYADCIIGANSSFSWWAAYLAKNEDSIKIFPRPWCRSLDSFESQLLPPSWQTIGFSKFEND